MPSIEGIKRKAQSAAYAATEKAQEAALAAGEKAGALKEYAGEKAEAIKAAAGEKAGALKDFAGERAGAIRDTAVHNVTVVSERRELDRNYRAIGEWYVATYGDDAPEAVADIVNAIRASRAKLAELRARGDGDGQEDEEA